MEDFITLNNVHKRYGAKQVLHDINLTVRPGEIVGVIGTNGAGKSTLLKSILGLSKCYGDIRVCGLNPRTQQAELMQQVSFIADTATLPGWINAKQLFDYMQTMHPSFDRELADAFLEKTQINTTQKVKTMSKGMVTQLHLAVSMAVKSKLLVLDEPTIGLDIVRRKMFYQQVLDDYYDKENTILITTHQLDEVEKILTRVVFIDKGQVIGDISVDSIDSRYLQVSSKLENHEALLALSPMYVEKVIEGHRYLFEGQAREALSSFGRVSIPELSDIFIALYQGAPQARLLNKNNREG